MKRSKAFFSTQKRIVLLSSIIGGLFALLMLFGLKLPPQEPPEELQFLDINLTKIHNEASIAFENKKYRDASKKYITILHYKPNDYSILYRLAQCYAFLNKPESASKVLNYALDAGLNDIATLLNDTTWKPICNHKDFKGTLEKASQILVDRGDVFYTVCKTIKKGYIRKPNSYDTLNAYPLLVVLHGNGSNAESYLAIRDRMDASNFLVALPEGAYPRKTLELKDPVYSWFYLTNDKKLWEIADPLAVDYVINVINEVKKNHKVSGVYILGHSQGGALAYMAGINNPELINGVICFGAQNPKDFLIKSILNKASKKVPIFISHGWSDPAVSFNEAQETKQMFLKLGFNVTFKPFQGGHWLDSCSLIEAKNWIEGIEKERSIK